VGVLTAVTRIPAARASARVLPTAHTCGSVKVTPGDDAVGGNIGGVTAEDRGRGDAAVVLAHVGQRSQAGAVTDRIQPCPRDACHAHLPIHGHRLPGLKTCPLHTDPGGSGLVSHRNQDLITGELPPVGHRRHHRAVGAHPAGCSHAR
jgi:hypothetical protein